MQYWYSTNEEDFNTVDIYEVGGNVVAKNVQWYLAERIVTFLNNMDVIQNKNKDLFNGA